MSDKGRKPKEKAPSRAEELAARESLFIGYYLSDPGYSAAAAARKIGYSKKTAHIHGARMLKRPNVAKQIAQYFVHQREKAEAKQEVTLERLTQELLKVAFGDTRRLMSWGPDGLILKDSESLTDSDAAMVSEISEVRRDSRGGGGSIKVKTHDKMKALEMLARLHGFDTSRIIAQVQQQDMGEATESEKTAFQDTIAAARAKWEAKGQ